jgi:predicted transcriptional regulator
MFMTTIGLKNILIQRIAGINDESFLITIKALIDSRAEPKIYKITPQQQAMIEEGRNQIAKGEYFTNEQVETGFGKSG